MTNTNTTPSSTLSSLSLSQLVSALQSLGIDIPHKGHQTQPTPMVTPTVSARISSPWVPSSIIPLPATTPAPAVAQSMQNQIPVVPLSTSTPPPAAAESVQNQVSVDQESPAVPASASTMIPVEMPSGFTCQHCQQYNLLRCAGDTWYTVTDGRNVGVFRGWHRVQPLVSGVPHASYRKYSSEAAATVAFEDAHSQGVVVIIA